MRCLKLITLKDGTVVPCGKCIPCKSNRRNDWNIRLQYESLAHPTSLFVGLSYNDEHIPFVDSSGHLTLRREDYIHYFERLRYLFKKDGYEPPYFRYYIIGEYGSTTFRPHYHIQFFTSYPIGFSDCLYAQDQDSSYCLNVCHLDCVVKPLRRAWPFGHVCSFPTTTSDIAYITLLHVTGIEPPFSDCEPAFFSASRRPGLGDYFFDGTSLASKAFSEGNAIFTYTPDGTLTKLPRYYRDRIFTPAERKFFFYEIPDDPSALAKSSNFSVEWMRNSWRAKGKI